MKKIIIILFIFLLCGCSDYSELNKLAIVSSKKKKKKNDNYLVNIEVLNTKKNGNKNLTYSGTGKTINLAINNIQNMPKLEDPNDDGQKKTLEEFKELLQKIDEKLDINKK